ncbi:Dimethyladenosine transferase 1 [Diplonema papillatum]|nr:Dimethyladenosine transferase 1 [Diplonema papillatum]
MLSLPRSCLSRQVRTAIGAGGPGFEWKKTHIGDQYRREGPIKRRNQQQQYGKKMEVDGRGFVSARSAQHGGGPQPEAGGYSVPQKYGRYPPVPSERQLLELFRVHHQASLPSRYLLNIQVGEGIVRRLGKLKEKTVVVLGTGAGLLTRCLCEAGANRVVGVEVDDRWAPHYDALQAASKGVFSYKIDDALTVDLAAVLEEVGCEQRGYEDESDVVIMSCLPPEVEEVFWMKLCSEVSERTGAFSFGRAMCALVTRQPRAVAMTSGPNHPHFGPLSMQAHAYFNTLLAYPIHPASYLGVERQALPDSLVLLEPKQDAIQVKARLLFAATDALKVGDSSLFTMIADATTHGLARRVLDDATVDGGLQLGHLTFDEIYRVIAAYAKHVPAEAPDREVKQRATKNVPTRVFATDPLLDRFLEGQATAARW